MKTIGGGGMGMFYFESLRDCLDDYYGLDC